MFTLLGENWGLWEDSEWGIGPEQQSEDPVNPLKGAQGKKRRGGTRIQLGGANGPALHPLEKG